MTNTATLPRLNTHQRIALNEAVRGRDPRTLVKPSATTRLRALALVTIVNDQVLATADGHFLDNLLNTHLLRLGRIALSTRYGTAASCTCGEWADRTNETPTEGGNREMTAAHAAHLDTLWAARG